MILTFDRSRPRVVPSAATPPAKPATTLKAETDIAKRTADKLCTLVVARPGAVWIVERLLDGLIKGAEGS